MSGPICYIVGAGEDCGLSFVPRQDDLVIAADGGLNALRAVSLEPQIIIGDFDSLGLVPQGSEVITLPKVKDVTDTWAAVEEGMRHGFRHFRLYGCTGGRFEHTLANLQTAAHLAQLGMDCQIIGKTQVITALCCGTAHFSACHTGYLSVFSFTEQCTGVTLKGLKYTLENAVLTSCFPLGVSNEFLGTESSVTVADGTAILVYDRL